MFCRFLKRKEEEEREREREKERLWCSKNDGTFDAIPVYGEDSAQIQTFLILTLKLCRNKIHANLIT